MAKGGIDVQIIAGKRLDVLAESVYRLLQQKGEIAHVYIKNNTDKDIPINHPKITIVPNDGPKTFEENHNQLAKLGHSEFILFLDDDAFLFEGAVEAVYNKIQTREDIACVGGVNNQTYPSKISGNDIPTIGSLSEFKKNIPGYTAVAKHFRETYLETAVKRLFVPGNFLLVRRQIWQGEYGGWDEGYKNWNEEVDFAFWCYDHGYDFLCMLGVWFYHCQAQSRRGHQLYENILESSKHFQEKWPDVKVKIFKEKIARKDKVMAKEMFPEMNMFLETNKKNSTDEGVRANQYYMVIRALVEN